MLIMTQPMRLSPTPTHIHGLFQLVSGFLAGNACQKRTAGLFHSKASDENILYGVANGENKMYPLSGTFALWTAVDSNHDFIG